MVNISSWLQAVVSDLQRVQHWKTCCTSITTLSHYHRNRITMYCYSYTTVMTTSTSSQWVMATLAVLELHNSCHPMNTLTDNIITSVMLSHTPKFVKIGRTGAFQQYGAAHTFFFLVLYGWFLMTSPEKIASLIFTPNSIKPASLWWSSSYRDLGIHVQCLDLTHFWRQMQT